MRIGSGLQISHLYLSNMELYKCCKTIEKLAKELGVPVRIPPISTLKRNFCSLSQMQTVYIDHQGFINYCPILTEVLPDGSRVYSAHFDFEEGKVISAPLCQGESDRHGSSENSPSGCEADDLLHPEETRSASYGIVFSNCCTDMMSVS
jgi:hypothetical protein